MSLEKLNQFQERKYILLSTLKQILIDIWWVLRMWKAVTICWPNHWAWTLGKQQCHNTCGGDRPAILELSPTVVAVAIKQYLFGKPFEINSIILNVPAKVLCVWNAQTTAGFIRVLAKCNGCSLLITVKLGLAWIKVGINAVQHLHINAKCCKFSSSTCCSFTETVSAEKVLIRHPDLVSRDSVHTGWKESDEALNISSSPNFLLHLFSCEIVQMECVKFIQRFYLQKSVSLTCRYMMNRIFG